VAELLAEDGVARMPFGEARPDRLFDGAVRLGDGGEVGLGIHDQIVGEEPIHRDRVRDVSEGEREIEVSRHAAAWY
jgi:hypothetical protein